MCSNTVQNVNIALVPGEKLGMKGLTMDPTSGNVIFGSALYGWAFNLQQFAAIYAKKTGTEEGKFMQRLWGDQFFNAKKKTWTKSEVEGSVRGFCQFIMNPIISLHKAILGGDAAKWEKMCGALGVEITADDKKLEGKALLRRVFAKWMNCGDAVTKMMATHLPSPIQAQKERIEHIYQGEMDSDIAKSMIACDKEGPVMMHVVRMIPTGSAGRFYGLGRLFSGTMSPDKYTVRGPQFDPEDPETSGYSQDGRIQALNVFLGKDVAPIGSCPAGNIVGLTGVDQFMVKTATVTNKKAAYNFTNFKFNVSAVLKIAIRPADPKQLPKLVEGLKRLEKADMLVATKSEPTGDHIIAGCGDEHLKQCLKDLRTEYALVDFTQGVPTVSYKETVTCLTEKDALSKSPNKHNRLYVKCEPMEEECSLAIEEYKINAQQDVKKRARILIDEFGWEKTDCMKIWGFGPNDIGIGGANVLVDQTKGIQYLNEIKESVNSGLGWASREGPLAEENMRGIKFNLMDAKLHADSIHRGMGQIQPSARRVFFAATMMSEPRFCEPIFKAIIACPEDVVGGVRQAIAGKRGILISEEDVEGKIVITAMLPISETIGDDPFSKVLQTKTSGKAFSTYAFDHWELIDANPLQAGSKAEKIMFDIRERKGLKVEQPVLYDYLDKL
jgi:elongation factor 2